MSYVDKCDTDALLDVLKLNLHILAKLEVKCTEGLVKKKNSGVGNKRARNCYSLLLTARKCAYALVFKTRKRYHLEHFGYFFANLLLGLLFKSEGECYIFINVEVGEESIFLENRIDVSLVGRKVIDYLILKENCTLVGSFKSADNTKGCGFAASGRAEKRYEFLISNVEVDIVKHGFSVVLLVDMLKIYHLGVGICYLGFYNIVVIFFHSA